MVTILVTYASKHGSTKTIAATIARVLQDEHITVDLLPVERVRNLADYHAVVIGSAIYDEKWMPEAAQFLRQHRKELIEKPVWLFSSGVAWSSDTTLSTQGYGVPLNIRTDLDIIRPRDIALFSGRLDLRKLSLAELNRLSNSFNGALGDHRDWDNIADWAHSIRAALAGAHA